MAGTYGLLIWINLTFSRVLGISQRAFGFLAEMGGWKSLVLFDLVGCGVLKFSLKTNFSSLDSDTQHFPLLFEIFN